MKNHNYDERVIQVRRKINSYAFSLCYLFLLMSIIIKALILNLDESSYVSEMLIFFATSLFVLISSVKEGIFISGLKKSSKTKIIVYSIINIVIILGFISISSSIKSNFSIKNTIIYFMPISIISFIIMFVVFWVLDKLNKKVNENELK